MAVGKFFRFGQNSDNSQNICHRKVDAWKIIKSLIFIFLNWMLKLLIQKYRQLKFMTNCWKKLEISWRIAANLIEIYRKRKIVKRKMLINLKKVEFYHFYNKNCKTKNLEKQLTRSPVRRIRRSTLDRLQPESSLKK